MFHLLISCLLLFNGVGHKVVENSTYKVCEIYVEDLKTDYPYCGVFKIIACVEVTVLPTKGNKKEKINLYISCPRLMLSNLKGGTNYIIQAQKGTYQLLEKGTLEGRDERSINKELPIYRLDIIRNKE